MAEVHRDHAYEIDQGDVLESVPFIVRRGSNATVRPGLGVVTSHGCECERYTRERDERAAPMSFLEHYPLQVAPLRPPDQPNNQGLLGDIRRGRVLRYFFVPAEGELPDLVVNLIHEQPIPAILLLQLRRVASLNEEYWLRLVVHIFRLQSHKNPEQVFTREFLGET